MSFNFTPGVPSSGIPRFLVRLVLNNGVTSLPVSSARMTYSIIRNKSLLPFAEVNVVVGKDLQTGQAIDLSALSGISRKTRAKIQFSDPTNGTSRILFDGFVGSVSSYRTDGSYGVSVGLVHWLSLLDGSTAYSAGMHATFPESVYRPAGRPSGTGAVSSNTFNSLMDYVNSISVSTDVWCSFTDALYGAYDLAKNTQDKDAALASLFAYVPNVDGMAILDKIESRAFLSGSGAAVLSTDIGRSSFQNMVGSISVSASSGSVTLLDKILNYAAVMNCMLVPAAETACFAPDGSFANSANVGLTIDDTDQASAEMRFNLHRHLRGCIMLGTGRLMNVGIFGDFTVFPVSSFTLKESPPDGMLITTDAPPWLEGLLPPLEPNFQSPGDNGCYAQSRGDTGADAGKAVDTGELNSAVNVLKAAAEDHCKMVWARAMTDGNLIRVAGPLRFDAGPGTQVMVLVTDQLVALGMIESVQLELDASRGTVMTGYTVSGARELADDALGFQRPPLYAEYLKQWGVV